VAAGAATGAAAPLASDTSAASVAEASRAYQAALRRQLLALLGDEPTGHLQSSELP
jgi:hypothetical protein